MDILTFPLLYSTLQYSTLQYSNTPVLQFYQIENIEYRMSNHAVGVKTQNDEIGKGRIPCQSTLWKPSITG